MSRSCVIRTERPWGMAPTLTEADVSAGGQAHAGVRTGNIQ